MKRFLSIAFAAIFVLFAFTACGTGADPTPRPTARPITDSGEVTMDSWEKDVMFGAGTDKILTADEAIALFDGKTEIKKSDMPLDKACYSIEGYDVYGFRIEDKFTVSCMFASSLCCIKYYENGKCADSCTKVSDFADFIREHLPVLPQ